MSLTLTEKFILLAHHPEKGRYAVTMYQHQYGLIGSLLMELSLKDIVAVENKRLYLKKKDLPADEVLSEIVQKLASSSNPRRIRYWISKFSFRYRKYKWAIYANLERQWMIKIEKKYFLGIIPYRRCYVRNKSERSQIIANLRENILYKKEMNDETVAFAALVAACSMQRKLTTNREELKVIKQELKRILKEQPVASAVKQTIIEVQAAVASAIVTATVATHAAS